jgi:hypothetical protein
MARSIALVALGCLAGLAAGYLLFSTHSEKDPPAAVERAPAPSPVSAIIPAPPAPTAAAKGPAPVLGSATPPPAPAAGAIGGQVPPEDDPDVLRERIAKLQAELKVQQQLLQDHEGTVPKAPDGLAARFTEGPVRTAVEKALKEAGLVGAQVSSVDCTEYPCIVYAEGMGGREDSEKLLKAPALGDYKDDGKLTSCSVMAAKAGADKRFCALSFTPKDDTEANRAAVAKRMHYRVDQMAETMR